MEIETSGEGKRNRMVQTNMPRSSLREALKLAEALKDNFAGSGASPIDLAKSVGRSPSSSIWRILTGAAVAYGLTDAAYNARAISLTTLGRQIVMPTDDGVDKSGLVTAALQPAIPKAFYEKYSGSKLPREDIARNVLTTQYGIPPERTKDTLKVILDNAELVGIMTSVGGNQYIQLRSSPPNSPVFSHPSFVVGKGAPEVNRPAENTTLLPALLLQPDLHVHEILKGKVMTVLPKELYNRVYGEGEDELHDTYREWIKQGHKIAKYLSGEKNSDPQEPESG